MHATLRKRNEKIKTKLLQDKTNQNAKFFNKMGKTTSSQAKETRAIEKTVKY